MAETDHAPKQNTLKSRLIICGVLGASTVAFVGSQVEAGPSPVVAIEQPAETRSDNADIYTAKLAFADALDEQTTIKRDEAVSRSKQRAITPSAECWDGSIDDLNHVPKSRAKIALGNIAIACELAKDEKWFKNNPKRQMRCLVTLWDRESGWYHKSGKPKRAYGIPQSLPGNKMAESGKDWRTNPATQVSWGLGYIVIRYDTPCDALQHHDAKNWY